MPRQECRSRAAGRASFLAGLLALVLAGPAAAQGLDHSALEALFGEPVTTSATGKPQRASDVPVTMDIITAEQIRRSGAHDIPTVLARYTSLDVQQYNEHDFSVSVRGYGTPGTPRLLVLLDGRQVYLDDYGRAVWHLIPVQLSEIRQIEVVKGPNSALYGFNAVGGVINIVTYDPAYDRIGGAVARLGSNNYRELSGVASARLAEGGGMRLSAGVREEKSWKRGYSAVDEALGIVSEPSRYQLAGSGTARLSSTVRASFDGSYSRSISSDFSLPGMFLPWDLRAWSLRGRLAAETGVGIVEASAYHNGLMTGLLSNAGIRQGVTVVQLSDTAKLSASHTVRPFVEYRHNAIEGGNTYEVGGAEGVANFKAGSLRVAYDVAAAGLMWNWAILPELEWTSALRYDYLWLGAGGYDSPFYPYGDADYRRSFGNLSWNLGLVWKATALDTVHASIARGVSSPSLFDMGSRVVAPGFGSVVGSPYLRPTKVDNYELGYRRDLAAIDGRLGVTAFYEMNGNIIASFGSPVALLPPYGTPTIIPSNVGASAAYGAELSLNGRQGAAIDWGAEYRLAMVEEPPGPDLVDFRRASPKHILSARAGWGSGPFRLDLFTRYATSATGYRSTVRGFQSLVVDDYATLGARAGYRLAESLTLALEGSNLLNGRQRQGIGLEAERHLFLSLAVRF